MSAIMESVVPKLAYIRACVSRLCRAVVGR